MIAALVGKLKNKLKFYLSHSASRLRGILSYIYNIHVFCIAFCMNWDASHTHFVQSHPKIMIQANGRRIRIFAIYQRECVKPTIRLVYIRNRCSQCIVYEVWAVLDTRVCVCLNWESGICNHQHYQWYRVLMNVKMRKLFKLNICVTLLKLLFWQKLWWCAHTCSTANAFCIKFFFSHKSSHAHSP